jgi:hypothetical protein
VIDYAKTSRGDILRVVGAGAPGHYALGELVRVKRIHREGVLTENKDGVEVEFVFNCGAARLEPTEWRDDFPTPLTPEDEALLRKIESGEIPCKAVGEV